MPSSGGLKTYIGRTENARWQLERARECAVRAAPRRVGGADGPAQRTNGGAVREPPTEAARVSQLGGARMEIAGHLAVDRVSLFFTPTTSTRAFPSLS